MKKVDSPSWEDEYMKHYDEYIGGDDELTKKIADGDKDALFNAIYAKTNSDLDKLQKRTGREKPLLSRHPYVKHYKKMYPKAREEALKRRYPEVAELAKKNKLDVGSRKFRFKEGLRKWRGLKRRVRVVYVGKKGSRSTFWKKVKKHGKR